MLCTKNQMEIFEFYLNRIFQDESSTRQLNSYLKVLEHWTEKLDIKIIDLWVNDQLERSHTQKIFTE